ncbi:MAG: APC family permease [Myxococcota bacterium]|nr:APC family permease [Myxococcota bacterium]
METSAKSQESLHRVIGLFGAVGLGLGSILGTGVFVSLAMVTDVAGAWAPVAVALAGILAACNGLSSAQLAAAHPVSGGTYEYGHKYLHPVAGCVAGWMFLMAKGASAATAAQGLAAYLIHGFGMKGALSSPRSIALVVVVGMTVLAAGGLRRSSAVNVIIVAMTLGALGIFVVAGIHALNFQDVSSYLTFQVLKDNPVGPSSIMHATALAFVAYAGYGRIATLGEEVSEPKKTIPRAIVVTLFVSMAIYISVVTVSVASVGPANFADAGQSGHAPLEQVARSLGQGGVALIVAAGAIAAMAGVFLNLVLGLSRVLLAMARRGEMPRSLSRITPSGESPKRAVLTVGFFIAALVSLGDIKMTWSLSAFCVLIYYGITNLAALRMPVEARLYPRWVAWVGFSGCFFLSFFIDVQTVVLGSVAVLFSIVFRSLKIRKY